MWAVTLFVSFLNQVFKMKHFVGTALQTEVTSDVKCTGCLGLSLCVCVCVKETERERVDGGYCIVSRAKKKFPRAVNKR